MVAVLPGEPQTSSVMVLALNWSRPPPDVPPPNEPLWTPKIPCSRYTTNVDSATTATIVSTSQKRLNSPFFLVRCGPSFSSARWGTLGSRDSVHGLVVVMGAFLTRGERYSANLLRGKLS